MHPGVRIGLGLLLLLGGLAWTLLAAGVLLIADKPAPGSAQYLLEVGVAWLQLAVALAVAAGGGWLLWRAWRPAPSRL